MPKPRHTLIVGVALLAALAAAACGEETTSSSSSSSTTPASSAVSSSEAAPASSEPAAPTTAKAKAKPKPAPAADDGDTGRMSDSEWSPVEFAIGELGDEGDQMDEEMQRCGAIVQTGDLPGFSDCVKGAYSGFNDKALTLYALVDDLRGDVAKQCLGAVRKFLPALAGYADAVKAYARAGELLKVDAFRAASKTAGKRSTAFALATARLEDACPPE